MDEADRAWHLARADAAWSALVRACVVEAGGVPRLLDGPQRPRAALWPLTQVLAAALQRAKAAADLGAADMAAAATADAAWLVSQAADHRRGEGFTDLPSRPWRRGRLYYDDDAWLGLCLVQGTLDGTRDDAAAAARVLATVRAGEAVGGGVRWREGAGTLHACSTGPAGQLAARLAVASGRTATRATADGDDLAAFALRCADFLVRITDADGLVADHLRPDGTVEPTRWSYNQGTALGLDLLLHRLSDDPALLDRARTRAQAAVSAFGEHRWEREPAAFMAILGRNLLALHGVDGDPRWPDLVDAYLARAAATSLDPATGLFDRPGTGRYDSGTALHQAAFVQLHALRARAPRSLPDVC